MPEETIFELLETHIDDSADEKQQRVVAVGAFV